MSGPSTPPVPRASARRSPATHAGLAPVVPEELALVVPEELAPDVPEGLEPAPYVELVIRPTTQPFSGHRASPQQRISLADVRGDALADYDIRDGDQLILASRPHAEHGDFAALPLSAVRFPFGMQNTHGGSRRDDPLSLWKVFPEARRLRLSTGPRSRSERASAGAFSAAVDAPIHGILIGILRRPRA